VALAFDLKENAGLDSIPAWNRHWLILLLHGGCDEASCSSLSMAGGRRARTGRRP